MCAYQFVYTTKLNQLTESEFVYGVPNLVFYFKCYNLPFFGWRYGNLDNYYGFQLCVCVCAKLQTHTWKTNILLGQLQKTFFFFSHITCTGGTTIEIICLIWHF